MEKTIIIDGQQRITTISLLLLALYNNIQNGNKKSEELLDDKILNEYLVNKYAPKEEQIKLKPIKKDKEAFERLFDNNSDEFVIESNLTQNYDYLYKRIETSDYTANELYNAVKKLMIVVIQLHTMDNPQLIFESMNSTGLDLTEADKIRNYVLMDKDYAVQEKFYTNYWNKIESNVSYDTTSFIKDYLTVKMQKVPTYSKIYRVFKEDFMREKNLEIEAILEDMLKYSKIYSNICQANTDNNKINKCLEVFKYLRYTLLYPYIMQLLMYYQENRLNELEVIDCLKTIETYILRRIICGRPTNALSKGFCNLDKEIISMLNKRNLDFHAYAEVMKYVLINKKGHLVFPNDNEFFEGFKKFHLYETHMATKNYVLESLENYQNKEKIVTLNSIENSTISIEHIIPQTLTPVWKKLLGDNYEQIHEKYKHTIGNLTLTGYNSEYSNKSFEEKRDMEKGFKESKLYLNEGLANLQNWGEQEILDRAELLGKRALEIWKMPSSNYQEENDHIDSYDLSDLQTSFIGKKIKSFKFDEHVYEVKSWKEFLEKIVRFLYELDRIPLIELVKRTESTNIRKRWSTEKQELRNPVQIDKDIYIETNYNTDAILNSIRYVLDAYQMETSGVEFVLRK